MEKIKELLLQEFKKVEFVFESEIHYFFIVDSEFFKGSAKVEKEKSMNGYYVEFKEENSNVYRGNGSL